MEVNLKLIYNGYTYKYIKIIRCKLDNKIIKNKSTWIFHKYIFV